jgi:hypothetical protein
MYAKKSVKVVKHAGKMQAHPGNITTYQRPSYTTTTGAAVVAPVGSEDASSRIT